MKRLFVSGFILIPVILSFIIFLKPDNEISYNENRNLKTLKNISVGEFQSDLESYLCDQFVFREKTVSVKSNLLYFFGKRDINGCYICTDRLIQKITDGDIDKGACEKYADRINRLAENTETFVILVPSAGISLKKHLPENAEMYDFNSLYESLSERYSNAKIINIGDVLTDSDAYYLTDHHWTAKGAYAAYLKWCTAAGSSAREFEFQTVAEDFKGTLYSKALLASFPPDKISAPVINDDITVIADGKRIDLYDKAALETKNMYDFFEGGNHGILTIENNSVNNGKVLLILKDSFANSFVPYLIGDYAKIIMVDERYTFLSPADIIISENVSQILVLKEISS